MQKCDLPVRRRAYSIAALILFLVACSDEDGMLPIVSDDGVRHVPEEYSTIQQALDASESGDEIVLASGVYSEKIVVPPHGLTLRSGSDDPSDTILDGTAFPVPDSLPEDDEVLIFLDGETSELRRLRGITVCNAVLGVATTDSAPDSRYCFEKCRFANNGPFRAMEIRTGSVEIDGCEFIENTGLVVGGAANIRARGSIVGSVFRGNDSVPYRANVFTQGGALFLAWAPDSVEVTDCVFEGNTATDYGGAIWAPGLSDGIIRGNTFTGNVADICAGAIYVHGNMVHVNYIEDNLFVDNASPLGGSIGIENSAGTVIRGNTIVRSKLGEGIRMVDVVGAIVDANVIAFSESDAVLGLFTSAAQTCNVAFGNATNTIAGTDNIVADPMFCDDTDNFAVMPSSPCVAENNACSRRIGAFDAGCAPAPQRR